MVTVEVARRSHRRRQDHRHAPGLSRHGGRSLGTSPPASPDGGSRPSAATRRPRPRSSAAILLTEQAFDGPAARDRAQAATSTGRATADLQLHDPPEGQAEPEPWTRSRSATTSPAGRARAGRRRGLRPLAALGRARRRRRLDYARIVRDDALLRAVLSTTREIQDAVLSQRGDPRELIERAEAALFRIAHEGARPRCAPWRRCSTRRSTSSRRSRATDVGLTGTPSGFTDLDALTGGFQPGNLIVLAARPSMGKSTLATEHRRERGHRPRRVRGPLLPGDVPSRAGPPLHRAQAKVSSDELRKGRSGVRWPGC